MLVHWLNLRLPSNRHPGKIAEVNQVFLGLHSANRCPAIGVRPTYPPAQGRQPLLCEPTGTVPQRVSAPIVRVIPRSRGQSPEATSWRRARTRVSRRVAGDPWRYRAEPEWRQTKGPARLLCHPQNFGPVGNRWRRHHCMRELVLTMIAVAHCHCYVPDGGSEQQDVGASGQTAWHRDRRLLIPEMVHKRILWLPN